MQRISQFFTILFRLGHRFHKKHIQIVVADICNKDMRNVIALVEFIVIFR